MKIILDTNIYRNLIRNKTPMEISRLQENILNAAKNKSITITFPIIPAMELINHYNDTNPIEQEECRKALNLLVNLSTDKTVQNLHVKFPPPMDVILGNYFFGKENNYLEMYAQIISVAQKLTGNDIVKPEDDMENIIIKIGKQLDYEKKIIRDNYENYLKSINEGSVDWTYFQSQSKKNIRKEFFKSLRKGELSFLVAQSFIDRAYFHAHETYEKNEDFFHKVIKFMEDFCPVLVMNELLLENIGHGVIAISDLTDVRWNTVLDISLIFGVLYNPKNENIKLVTEDTNIINSFGSCGLGSKCIRLNDFFELLEIEQ